MDICDISSDFNNNNDTCINNNNKNNNNPRVRNGEHPKEGAVYVDPEVLDG